MVCIITYDEPMYNILTKPDRKVDLLLSFQAAVDQDPDLIVVSLGRMGANAQRTSDLMRVLKEELAYLQRDGKARSLVDQKSTPGVLCFFFTQPELKDEFDPEKGFPAVLCVVDSLVVVAASWPPFPMRVGHRVLQAYVDKARRCVEQPAGIVVAGNFGMHVMHADRLATAAGCLAAARGSMFVFVTDGLETKSMKFLQVDEPCVSLVQRQLPRPQRQSKRSCAEQPAPRKDRSNSCAEQPAVGASSSVLALANRPAVVRRERTPLYDNFLDSMQKAGAGGDILNFLATDCFFGDLCYYDKRGQEYPQPISIAGKMEVMLGEVLEQRKLHINRLKAAGDPRVPPSCRRDELARLKFTNEDMKKIMNFWRLDVESWMHPNTLALYRDSPNWHKIGKSAFSVFLQQLSGCKFLLRRLIALPLHAEGASAARPGAVDEPEILRELTQEWGVFKNTEEHRRAMQTSQPRCEQARFSKRLCWAQTWYKQGAKLSRMGAERGRETDGRRLRMPTLCRDFGRPVQRKNGSAALPWRGSRAALTVLNSRRRSS